MREGRRRALIVGIDSYPGFGWECQLAGAVRDARCLAEVLSAEHGFRAQDVRLCLGEEATRDAILEAMASLLRDLKPKDEVVLFFSGHGSQMTDREGDEGDGLDETIVPCDSGRAESDGFLGNRDISDDEIHLWASRVLGVTLHLTMIFDCCHAATLHRPDMLVKSVPADLRPSSKLPLSPLASSATPRNIATGPRPLILAACGDHEEALELPPNSALAARGAFSHHMIEALRDTPSDATWRQVFEHVRLGIGGEGIEQQPQISGSGIDSHLFGGERGEPRRREIANRLRALTCRGNLLGFGMRLLRSRGGPWREVPVAKDKTSEWIEGDRLWIEFRHGHSEAIYIYLFDIGLDETTSLLFPDHEGHEPLDPGLSLSIGRREGDPLTFEMPLSWGVSASSGTGQIVAVASPSPLSTSWLLAGAPGSDSGEAMLGVEIRTYELHRRFRET